MHQLLASKTTFQPANPTANFPTGKGRLADLGAPTLIELLPEQLLQVPGEAAKTHKEDWLVTTVDGQKSG